MGKIVYKRYQIRLHRKNYDILVPYRMPEKLWLAPYGSFYKNGEGADLLGDRYAMKCMRNAFITLAQEPDKIIYFPLNQRWISYDRLGLHRIPQLVFYNHNIQLKRREWQDILKIIQGGYRKPEQYVVYLNYSELEKRYENMLHQWMKSKSYYRWNMIGEYVECNTYFFESDKRTNIQVVVIKNILRCVYSKILRCKYNKNRL